MTPPVPTAEDFFSAPTLSARPRWLLPLPPARAPAHAPADRRRPGSRFPRPRQAAGAGGAVSAGGGAGGQHRGGQGVPWRRSEQVPLAPPCAAATAVAAGSPEAAPSGGGCTHAPRSRLPSAWSARQAPAARRCLRLRRRPLRPASTSCTRGAAQRPLVGLWGPASAPAAGRATTTRPCRGAPSARPRSGVACRSCAAKCARGPPASASAAAAGGPRAARTWRPSGAAMGTRQQRGRGRGRRQLRPTGRFRGPSQSSCGQRSRLKRPGPPERSPAPGPPWRAPSQRPAGFVSPQAPPRPLGTRCSQAPPQLRPPSSAAVPPLQPAGPPRAPQRRCPPGPGAAAAAAAAAPAASGSQAPPPPQIGAPEAAAGERAPPAPDAPPLPRRSSAPRRCCAARPASSCCCCAAAAAFCKGRQWRRGARAPLRAQPHAGGRPHRVLAGDRGRGRGSAPPPR